MQGVGKIPFDVEAMGIDLLSLTAHKMYGPKGVGALYVRRRSRACGSSPHIDGGGHERGMRSGTLNVPGIVGFGKACRDRARRDGRRGAARSLRLRERLREGIMRAARRGLPERPPEHRLPGNLNISFAYVEGEALLMGIKDVGGVVGLGLHVGVASSRRYVLRALGVGDELAHTSIRFGLGRFNTEEEVDYVVDRVVDEVQAAARAVAALRDGARKASISKTHRSGQRTERLRTERRTMAYSDKVIDHYENPRNVGHASTRTTRASAPASSARRSAAT